MDTFVIPLGTGSALPKKGRHFSCTALLREDVMLLFDCGEGTQLRLLDAGFRRTRLESIFITHLHGDHIYGLHGLVNTLTLLGFNKALCIYGPPGIRDFIMAMPRRKSSSELSYVMDIQEIQPDQDGTVIKETGNWKVVAAPLQHSIPTIGYRFEEKPIPGHLDVDKARALGIHTHEAFRKLKQGEAVTNAAGQAVAPSEVVGPDKAGKVFAYLTDTQACPGGRLLAKGADLVYHEATFMNADAKRALETKHATAQEAAEVARDAGARRLLIGHFSLRYDDPAAIVREARTFFQNTEAAVELKQYQL